MQKINNKKYRSFIFVLSFGLIICIVGSNNVYSTLPDLSTLDFFSPTNNNSLDVKITPIVNPISTESQSKFKIEFFEPGTDMVQVHVDYDFIITKNDENLFSAAQLTGQPLLHTAEGAVTIPYSFTTPGEYNITVLAMGINFIPIKEEFVSFPIIVT